MISFNRSRQSGVSLLEVLIAVLVLSIGLLGVAGLQLSAMKSNQTASMRSQATVLAYDITDRMRANRPVARAGGYTWDPQPAFDNDGEPLPPDVPSTATVAGKDLSAWLAALARHLPEGEGTVVAKGNRVVVTVSWDESRLGTTDTIQQFVFETRL